MPFNKSHESNRFQVFPIGLLLGIGFVLYVCRFPVGIGNISMLGIAMCVLGIFLLLVIAQSKRILSAAHLVSKILYYRQPWRTLACPI